MSPPVVSLSGPLFLFLASMAAGAACYLVHRWTLVAGLIAAATCLALGWLVLHQPVEEPLVLLGRAWLLRSSFVLLGQEWAFTAFNLGLLAFTWLIAGLAFALARPASQGWSFYPFGLGTIGALTLAITAQQYIYALLFLWLAANLAAFVLSGGRPGETAGAWRFLVLTSMAVMPLLVLPRYLETDVPASALQTAIVFMTIGFAILLMAVPFHGQMIAMAASAAPMAPALVLSLFSPVVFYILIDLGRAHPQLLQNRLLFDVCRWMGTAAVALGGVAVAGQRRWGYTVGYATLVDWGAGLVALGQGTARGVEQATHMLVWRAFSLLLVGSGLTVLFKAMGKKDDLASVGGMLSRRPAAVLTLVTGMLSLAAFPLTPGAAGRWPLILDLLAARSWVAWVLILSGVGVSVATLVSVRACSGEATADTAPRRLEAVIGLGFAVLALWLFGYFFLHPAPWLEMVRPFLDALPFLPT